MSGGNNLIPAVMTTSGTPATTKTLKRSNDKSSTNRQKDVTKRRSLCRILLLGITMIFVIWMWHISVIMLQSTTGMSHFTDDLNHMLVTGDGNTNGGVADSIDHRKQILAARMSNAGTNNGPAAATDTNKGSSHQNHQQQQQQQQQQHRNQFIGSHAQRKAVGKRVIGPNNVVVSNPLSIERKKELVEKKVNAYMTKFPESCRDKEAFLRIIFSADDSRRSRGANRLGLVSKNQDDIKVNKEVCKTLPTEAEVNAIHGPEPVIYGMETCAAYRELLKPENNQGKNILPKPRVSGLYHTGTNALSRSFDSNIRKLNLRTPAFSPYEVPWGKHLPPAVYRLTHTYPDDNPENRFLVLPVVLIRDPFYWMQSMCRAKYDADWVKPGNLRCPALVLNAQNRSTYKVTARTHQTHYQKQDNYTSLVDMWSTWYTQYLEADYPRLIIRFEDTLYRLREVVDKVRECIGMNKTDPTTFTYYISNPKVHGMPTDYLNGLRKYASTKGRHRGLNKFDREYVHEAINPKLMELFHYKQVPLEVPPEDLKEPFIGWKHEKPKDKKEEKKPTGLMRFIQRNQQRLEQEAEKRMHHDLLKQKKIEAKENGKSPVEKL